MNLKKACLAAALTLAGLGSAHADQTWIWSYTGPDIVASGTFTTAGAALTPEPILSITGFRNGLAITGLVALDTDPNFTYDNLFTISSPNLSEGGFLYSVAGGQPNTNVYFFSGQYSEVYVDGLSAFDSPIEWTVAAAPVPEPATALALLTGLGVLGLRLHARRREA